MDAEILDGLAADDPRAIASRRDLMRLNFCLGSHRWIEQRLRRAERNELLRLDAARIVELGAGDGRLIRRLATRWPRSECFGIDATTQPCALPRNVSWQQADLRASAVVESADVLVGSFILHHFGDAELAALGKRIRTGSAQLLVFVEPLRSLFALRCLNLLRYFFHPVTRHDAACSIRAGFAANELAVQLGLHASAWQVTVRQRGIGTYYMEGQRRCGN